MSSRRLTPPTATSSGNTVYGDFLAPFRRSTMRKRWLASRTSSNASSESSMLMSRCESAFLYEPMVPAKRNERAWRSDFSAVKSVSGPLSSWKALCIKLFVRHDKVSHRVIKRQSMVQIVTIAFQQVPPGGRCDRKNERNYSE